MKAHLIKSHMWVFVNCLVENPAFDSQTKETLTTRISKFGSAADLNDKFLKQVAKCGIVDHIVRFAQFKVRAALDVQS